MNKMGKNLYKVQASVKHGEVRKMSHFCYIPNDLKQLFDKHVNTGGIAMHYYMREWALRYFGIEIETADGLEILKDAINSKYCEKYGELTQSENIDRLAFRKLWMSECIKKELENVRVYYQA